MFGGEPPPLAEKDPAKVGCRTTIGTGDVTLMMAAVAAAFILFAALAPRSRNSVVCTGRVISTCTAPGLNAGDKVTPGTEPGKSTVIVSDEPAPPKPFCRAYTQGVRPSVPFVHASVDEPKAFVPVLVPP
jgi:hypothetical protein